MSANITNLATLIKELQQFIVIHPKLTFLWQYKKLFIERSKGLVKKQEVHSVPKLLT